MCYGKKIAGLKKWKFLSKFLWLHENHDQEVPENCKCFILAEELLKSASSSSVPAISE